MTSPKHPVARITDLQGLRARGAADRRAGASYFDNPMYQSTAPIDTTEQLFDWVDLGNAWSAGWLEEDAGRDAAIQRLMRVRYW